MSNFCLAQDNSGHWYVIPSDREKDWQTFCSIPEDDERSWDVPSFADPVGGSPSLVRFPHYHLKGAS